MILRLLSPFLLLALLGGVGKLPQEKQAQSRAQQQERCIRTYIPRPQGDAIRCTECRFVLADGSSIKKEGC